MKILFLSIFIILFVMIQPVNAQLSSYIRSYLTDEKAPGARAAMGIFASGYGKALAESTFDFPMNTWQNRLTSIGIAAVSYQIISYDTKEGLQFSPFTFNKEWKGYWGGYAIGEGMDLFLGYVARYDAAKFIIGSTITILMSIVIVEGQSTGGFRWAKDGPFGFEKMFKNRHSWWVHFTASGGLYWAISNHTGSRESALIHTLPLIWLWEVKDGFLPWEKYGWIGGDGFSWRDGLAGSIAVFGSYAFDKRALTYLKTNLFIKKDKYRMSFLPQISSDQLSLRVLLQY
jgi:hypothetical protein